MPARFDADAAPHVDLLRMRRGTAHFARVLNELSDAEISADWEKRLIVAAISQEARRLAIYAKSLHGELTDDEANFNLDIPYTATLPVHALRHLFVHSALHLNVELRDLEDRHWHSASSIPKNRADAIWDAAGKLL